MEKILKKITMILSVFVLTIGFIGSSATNADASSKWYYYKYKLDVSVKSTDVSVIKGPYKVYVETNDGGRVYIGQANRDSKLSLTYKRSLSKAQISTKTKNLKARVCIEGYNSMGKTVSRRTAYKKLSTTSTTNLKVRGNLAKNNISF